jgi:hypothetical protein
VGLKGEDMEQNMDSPRTVAREEEVAHLRDNISESSGKLSLNS